MLRLSREEGTRRHQAITTFLTGEDYEAYVVFTGENFQLPSKVSGWLLANTFPPNLLGVGPAFDCGIQH